MSVSKPTQVMFADEEVVQKPKRAKKAAEDVQVEEVVAIPTNGARVLDLPSNGQFGYPASVEYRDMLAKDEEALSGATVNTYVRTLNGVVKGVLNDCSFYDKMCIADRDYALIWLWANNYDPIKRSLVTCRHCEHENKVNVDLTTLEVTEPPKEFTGAFRMDLTNGGEVIVKLNTVADEMLVEQYIASNPDEEAKYDYLMRVASIQGGTALRFEDKIKWVGENITSKEMAKIREFHRRFKFGVKTILDHKCVGCGEVTQFDLPFSAADVLLPNANVGEVDFDFV